MSNVLREFDKRHAHDLAIAKLRTEQPETPRSTDNDGSTKALPKSSFNAIMESKIEVPEYDRLTDLFKSTKGEKWKHKKKWNVKPNREGIMCEKEGIKFADDLQPGTNLQVVEEIEMESNFMQGTLPDSIGFFAGLKRMTLKMNNIGRAIPTSISNLTCLVILDLSQNSFQMKLPRQFPRSLISLNLSQNRLTGQIPVEFSFLVNLVELNLNSNRLTGGIPESLSALNKLEILDVGRNGLDTFLPLNIAPGITNLKHLDLSENQIEGSVPINFAQLSNLRFFSIHDNNFVTYKDTLERALGGMTALTELDISKNQFFGQVPACVARMTSLQTLDVSQNYFEGPLPLGVITFQQRRRNTALRMDKNKNLCLPKNMGVLGLGIVELNLSAAGICGVLPASFGELIYLRSLEMPHNHLNGEIPESFKLLEQLEVLNLNSNEISGGFLPCFATWTKLQVLDMGNNVDFNPGMPNELSTLRDLKALDLTGCKYSSANSCATNYKIRTHIENIEDNEAAITSSPIEAFKQTLEDSDEKKMKDENDLNVLPHDSRLCKWIPQHAEDYLKAFNLAVTIETLGNCGQCGHPSTLSKTVSIQREVTVDESEEAKLLRQFAEEDGVWKNEEGEEEEEDSGRIEPENVPFPDLPDSASDLQIGKTPNADGSFKAKLRGERALSDENYEVAIEQFTEALMMSAPAEEGLKATLYRVQLLSKRAQCLMALKRPLAVIHDCTAALSMNNQNGTLLSLRGLAYRQIGEWELANVDLSSSMTINCDLQQVPLLDLVREKVAKLEERRRDEEEKQRIRSKLLEEARMRDEINLGGILYADEEDGFQGGPDKKSLKFDLRGEVEHIRWIGDVAASGKCGGIAGGIMRLGRVCCHDTFANYLIRIDIRGHLVSDEGMLEVAKAIKLTPSIVTFRASQNGIDFDVSSDDLSTYWRLYSFPIDLAKLDRNRAAYILSISSPLQLEILARVIFARPKVLGAKVDIKKAYSGIRNASAKSFVVIDPSTVMLDKSNGFLVHGRIKVAFIIAFLLEPNPLQWMQYLNRYENELWFCLVTAAKDRKFIFNGKALNYYLDPLGSDWEDLLCRKIDILIASQRDKLVFAHDWKDRRALDVANPKIKYVMSKHILLAGRYLLDAIAMPPPATVLYQSARSLIVAGTDLHEEDDYGMHPRVAVKLMAYESDYQREVLVRDRFQLNEDFVTPILKAHIPTAGSGELKSVHPSIDAVLEVPTSLHGFEAFYFIVMPLADQDLMHFLEVHSPNSNDVLPMLSAIRNTLGCLRHVHSRGLIHANLDATNVVRYGKIWKLIDMDFATEINDFMTFPRILSSVESENGLFSEGTINYWRKVPAYLPPEIIRVESQHKLLWIDGCLENRWDRSADLQWKRWASEHAYGETENIRMKPEVETYTLTADVSFDLWQLGCLAYHILYRKKLMAVDHLSNPNSCVTHDGGDGEISTLFDLCTWDVERFLEYHKDCVKSDLLHDLTMNMLKQVPSERGPLQVAVGKSLKQFYQNSSVGRLEKYLIDEEQGVEGVNRPSEHEQSLATPLEPEAKGADEKFFKFSEDSDLNKDVERRSYYLQNLEGPTQKRIHTILELFGRLSPLERNSGDVMELNTSSESERLRAIKTRQLKQLIAAEKSDYPTAFVLTTPTASHLPTADDPVRWVNNYVYYIAPILLYPVVDEKNLSRMSAQQYVAAKAKEKEDKANAPPQYEPSSVDMPPYFCLNLVCEMCFRFMNDDVWPVKVSLRIDDMIFLRKISPLANATLKAAHKIFSGSWDETSQGGLQMYDGGYIESMLQLLGFRSFDKLHISKDSSGMRMELAQLLSCSSDLRALVRQNDQMMQKSVDDALKSKKRKGDEDLLMKKMFHLIAKLETNFDWENYSDLNKFLRRNHPMNRNKAIIEKKIKKWGSKGSKTRPMEQTGKITKSVSFQDLHEAASDEASSATVSLSPSDLSLSKLEFENRTFSKMDEKVQRLHGEALLNDTSIDVKSSEKDKNDRGYSAREFRAFLRANDPESCFGGLKRVVLPSGHSVWLCTSCFLNTISSNDTKKELQLVEETPTQQTVISTSIDINMDAIRKEIGN